MSGQRKDDVGHGLSHLVSCTPPLSVGGICDGQRALQHAVQPCQLANGAQHTVYGSKDVPSMGLKAGMEHRVPRPTMSSRDGRQRAHSALAACRSRKPVITFSIAIATMLAG